MRTVLLILTVVLLAAAAVLTVRSFRRDALDSLAALVLVLAAGVPAAAYGALAE